MNKGAFYVAMGGVVLVALIGFAMSKIADFIARHKTKLQAR